jgi:glycosyltransferase involved in cell wall biosynthesis
MKLAKKLVYVSTNLTQCIPKYFNDKAVAIPNGCSIIPAASHKIVSHAQLSGKDNPKTILTVGGTHPQKGAPFLIDSLEELPCGGINLVIFGARGSAHDYVNNRAIKTNIQFKGIVSQPELFKYYQTADIVIQASEYESFGMSPLEAICCGTPVILTESCGLAAYLTDFSHKHPWAVTIVKYGDIQGMVKAIMNALDISNRSELALDHFSFDLSELGFLSWNMAVKGYISLWNDIASHRSV